MEPAPAVAAELWRPPHLAAGGGHAAETVSAVTEKSNGSRGLACAGRRRQRDPPASEDDSSRIFSTSGGGGGGQDLTDSEAKRFKANKTSDDNSSQKMEAQTDSRSAGKAVSQNPPAPEPPKQDYIHVRARRGQATDSHSLAERARREKISERMKILQDLVPGCNKVIGKASVLDEIINYIQSLQCQVEFLSMKLEAVNAHVSNGVEAFPSKDFGAQTYNTAPGLTFDTQAPREYSQGASPSEWLHMQIGGAYERSSLPWLPLLRRHLLRLSTLRELVISFPASPNPTLIATPRSKPRFGPSLHRSPAMGAASPPQDQPQQQPAPVDGKVSRESAALTPRRARFPRACHNRPLVAPPTPAPAPTPPPPRPQPRRSGNAGDETPEYRVVTPLVTEPEAPAELPRFRLRGMWELASVLNFLHVFRPLLNIAVEFTAEELEDAIITPNATLDDVHMPLLKSIPPVTRMAMGRGTWVTVLCRKLKHWWHLVAEGDLPIVASHGAEIEMYGALEPATRLIILKAICDIRCEQEDIRNFIDNSLKHGYHLPVFRKERIGGDSYGISYWYEDDPILGHRLYREIRRVEYVKEQTRKSKGKGISSVPVMSYQWEAVATNFDEFKIAAEKLFSSRNRTEVSLGKKLNMNCLPEIEQIHKKKEKLLKKQQREALLLDSYLTANGFTSGRSRRERKRVTYTFDDYDRSINEAIKKTKRVLDPTQETSGNGRLPGPSPLCNGFYEESSMNRRPRRRSQRYTKDFVEAVSDIDPNFDSDDDIMGEAVYDEEYLRSRRQQKSRSSEDDEEFRLEQVAADGDVEMDHSLIANEDAEEAQWYKRLPIHNPQGTNLRFVDDIQIGIRRSKRSSRSRINYQQYDISGLDAECGQPEKHNASDPDAGSDAMNDMEVSTTSQDQDEEDGEVNKGRQCRTEIMHVPGRESRNVQRKFLALNEVSPVAGVDDTPALVKDEH
ncbi:hypothetical protein EJB05_03983 [Eragrostis curvula]|uniref:BHLH domain-containing protein n=1 Tax=Eragrostis curvula TaxID=38414 RepID=A0A5J9W8S3_9POAL|nr:hypothetical protein EJB05_03983 [Eragrostis curvula]